MTSIFIQLYVEVPVAIDIMGRLVPCIKLDPSWQNDFENMEMYV